MSNIRKALHNYFTELEARHVPQKDRPTALVHGLLSESLVEIVRVRAENSKLASAAVEKPPYKDDLLAELERLRTAQVKLQRFVDLQAEDEGLWCVAASASEAYIQRGLRGCHEMIEDEFTEIRERKLFRELQAKTKEDYKYQAFAAGYMRGAKVDAVAGTKIRDAYEEWLEDRYK